MKVWKWVRVDVVLAVHDQQLAEHGGMAGLPSQGRLEAALARPRNRAAYAKPDAAALAAAYAYGLLRNRPFADGNKRTAWVVARLVLADNGYRLQFDPIDAVRTMENAAAGKLTEVRLANWFRSRIV